MNYGRTINEAYDKIVRDDNVENYKRSLKSDFMVGKTIKILWLQGEPNYDGKIGMVKYVDDIGQLHGTWGSLAINPNVDEFEIINGVK